ncbi:MAG TPA: hemolysin family protein [Allosphingosinicella sp.]|nr:hemolysin family protein [Allosphingosinicella sp.]
MPPVPPLPPFPWFDFVIILMLIALNGVFAMAEMAIVSSRKPRLKAMAKSGRWGARTALDLASDPGRFLSTVQIGITLIGILAGAYSGASFGGPVGARLAPLGLDPETAATLGFVVVIFVTTYASLVIGELVPKQFALRSPEPIAAIIAPPMLWASKATAPLVWLLDRTSALIFRLLRMRRDNADKVTAEELHLVVAEAHHAGVLEEYERAIISGVVRLADRPAREVMTPRTDVDWVDASASLEEIRQALLETPHSRIPVAEGSVDKLIGIVRARDLVAALIEGRPLDMRALSCEAPVVPDQMDAMDALAVLRGSETRMAFVHDEYGHFEGILTSADLLNAISGALAGGFEGGPEAPLVEREDGSWWVSGSLSADALSDRLGIGLPEDRDYATTAGFALSVLKHIPEVGERFAFGGWQFEIVDMDGFKIDKLLASEVVRNRRGG